MHLHVLVAVAVVAGVALVVYLVFRREAVKSAVEEHVADVKKDLK